MKNISRLAGRSVFLVATMFIVAFAFMGAQSAHAQVASAPKGEVRATSTDFAIIDSDYLNISLHTTNLVSLTMTSIPKVINIITEATSSAVDTIFTVSGLLPNTTYYRYLDGLANLQTFISDASGSYNFILNIAEPHLVTIQTVHSTKIISAPTGGDCSVIGVWDAGALTCTLNTDVNESIQIASSGITLDGGGHAVAYGAYANMGFGVMLWNVSGITIKNIDISGFGYGVYNVRSSFGFTSGYIHNNGYGIWIDTAWSGFGVSSSTISSNIYNGIFAFGFAGMNITDNLFENNQLNISNQIFWSDSTIRRNTLHCEALARCVFIENIGGFGWGTGSATQNNFYVGSNPPISWRTSNVQFDQNYWSSNTVCVNRGDGVCSAPYSFPVDNPWWNGAGTVTDNNPLVMPGNWGVGYQIVKANPIYGIPPEFRFNNDLQQGSNITDVRYLQIVLNSTSTHVAEVGAQQTCWSPMYIPGASGCETSIYGLATAQAVTNFQQKNNIIPSGVVDLVTRTKLNELLVAGIQSRGALLNLGGRQNAINTSVNNLWGSLNLVTNMPGFPQELALAIAAQETGSAYQYNNEWMRVNSNVGDFGRGIMQITSPGYIGLGETDTSVTSLLNDCKSGLNFGYQCSQYYSNTNDGINRNIRDGLKALQDKYNASNNAEANSVILSQSEMRSISTVYRYNHGSPFDIQAAYLALKYADNQSVWGWLVAHGWSQNGAETTFPDTTLNNVRNICSGKTTSDFALCLKLLESSGHITGAFYLSNVADKLDPTQSVLAEHMKRANDSEVVAWLGSPAELRVIDNIGRVTGLANGITQENIPNSIYDATSNFATLFSPSQDIKYQVIGTATGTYSFVANNLQSSTTLEMQSIPIVPGEIYTYQINWDKISQGQKGVTMQIDQSGNGVASYTVEIGSNFSDTIAPTTTSTVTGTLGMNGWHTSDVSVLLDTVDNADGVGVERTMYSLDGGAWHIYSTSTPISISSEGQHLLQYYSKDYFSNQEPTKELTVNIDKSAPVISPSSTTSTYVLNAPSIGFNYSATDIVSGLASTTATLDGLQIATSTTLNFNVPGAHIITINAIDIAGNSTSTTINYSVVYTFGGFQHPIKPDGTGRYEFGRTLPIKFNLSDVNGNEVSTANARLSVVNVQTGVIGVNDVSIATSTIDNDINSDDRVEHDAINHLYVYKLRTKWLSVGTWRITVSLDDRNSYNVLISLRRDD